MPLNCVRKIDARNLTVSDFQQNQANNRPVVLTGLIDSWPALRAWSGNDGKKHLTSLAGKASVQVMVSDEGQYRGDMAHRSSMTMTFEDFLSTADRLNGNQLGIQQLYLAQFMAAWQYGMIWNMAFAESPDDKLIHGKQPFAVVGRHLRAAVPGGRAGITHQSVDVHQGFSLQPALRPLPQSALRSDGLQGSALHEPCRYSVVVSIPSLQRVAQPQCRRFYTARRCSPPALRRSPKAPAVSPPAEALPDQAGDALFLPEGWWHQVDSEEVTIAVNFWWRSLFDCHLGGHMDAYYLRRAAQSLTESRKAEILRQLWPQESDSQFSTDSQPPCFSEAGPSIGPEEPTSVAGSPPSGSSIGDAARPDDAECVSEKRSSERTASGEREGETGCRKSQRGSLQKDWELRAAERLAAALSEEFLQQASAKNNAPEDPGTGAAGLGLGDVSVQLMAAMDAWTLRRVLLAVARRFPRTLEAFLCGGLSPAAAELLTARFEAADAQLTHEGRHGEQQRFYEELYAVAERPESVLQALVHQKEEFARQACGMVLREAFQLPSL